jgi:hypothetical protein
MLLLSKTLQRLPLETVGGRVGYTPLRDNRGHRRTLSHAIEMEIKCYKVHKTCKSQRIDAHRRYNMHLLKFEVPYRTVY